MPHLRRTGGHRGGRVCSSAAGKTWSSARIAAMATRWPRAWRRGSCSPSCCGRATGCSQGRGGSMHLFAPEVGLMGTSGIVGPCILQAAGAGYSFKLMRSDRVAVAFFGDGAVNNGAFHEGLNMASIWKLPVLFVCENNQFATEVPFSYASASSERGRSGRGLRHAGRSRSMATTCWPSSRRPPTADRSRPRRPGAHAAGMPHLPHPAPRRGHGRLHLSHPRGRRGLERAVPDSQPWPRGCSRPGCWNPPSSRRSTVRSTASSPTPCSSRKPRPGPIRRRPPGSCSMSLSGSTPVDRPSASGERNSRAQLHAGDARSAR